MSETTTIRPLCLDDAAAVQRYASDKLVAQSTNVPWPYPEDGGEQFVRNRLAAHGSGRSYSFAILCGGELIGVVGINAVDRQRKIAHCDYAIASSHWGRGITTTAVALALRYAFAELGLETVRSECLVSNRASARVLEKNCFQEVGEFLYSSAKFSDEPVRRFELRRQEWIAATDSIATYYGRGNEDRRLQNGRGELEFLRTKEIIQSCLPEGVLSIADVGGGTGPYAFWLAELGHRVELYDLTPQHVDRAREINDSAAHKLDEIAVGDIRTLELAPGQFDLVLLLGPLYHLTEAGDRVAALRRASTWLKPGGRLITACISRFGSLLDGFIEGLFQDPEYVDIVRQDLATGRHRPNATKDRYFTDAHFHRVDEIHAELGAAGLEVLDVVGVEGIGWLWQDFDEVWSDPGRREILLEMVRATDRDPSLLGASGHILSVSVPAVNS